ncbi:hypothetical protein A2454_05990 [Candidatus Peribacteria bacterium RIFOXYC2_FULL_55_14]|nr:MAG: Protein-disulfide isomerase [Candidatus Peribacteria bacterium GW2011_GWC2_54_8]KKW38888.1 MAG: Protein-disulfide isomerase [Candidatus Peribacteria bacterium GW2011_GWB1_54_5]KKW40606.1 MAG: Protein-disulfide isomerase [Candidatus Peregrinibacteria bacterium GW2011_GWA2_54_9]OGJ71940.1 MAG: hypothetical protein A2198_03575 [Candidatus Peribacteria bacterium RIFOXYA1_FULL_56_14]OGJ72714.1 MAG: hypothetical protein A2217_04485 [Candidatus Peribacteria bacterium RIFOXYA2_FULL_55_28]OGJ75
MRRYCVPLLALLLFSACNGEAPSQVQNPDPNHLHADFAVWYEGEKLDFSGEEYQSGSLEEESDPGHGGHEHLHPYVHLHDGVGHVIHVHKPGFTLREFFDSLGQLDFFTQGHIWTMFINGQEEEFTLDYEIRDLDQIFLTTSAGSAKVLDELSRMTDDACQYSRTCPERGDPPREDCVSDPSVPCVVPPEDL